MSLLERGLFTALAAGDREAYRAAFDDREVTVVQMRNHGQVVIGSTWRRAVRRAALTRQNGIVGHESNEPSPTELVADVLLILYTMDEILPFLLDALR